MSKLLLPVLLLAMLVVLPGCSLFHKKPQSSSHITEGDASTIHFSDKPESAGGAINTY